MPGDCLNAEITRVMTCYEGPCCVEQLSPALSLALPLVAFWHYEHILLICFLVSALALATFLLIQLQPPLSKLPHNQFPSTQAICHLITILHSLFLPIRTQLSAQPLTPLGLCLPVHQPGVPHLPIIRSRQYPIQPLSVLLPNPTLQQSYWRDIGMDHFWRVSQRRGGSYNVVFAATGYKLESRIQLQAYIQKAILPPLRVTAEVVDAISRNRYTRMSVEHNKLVSLPHPSPPECVLHSLQ